MGIFRFHLNRRRLKRWAYLGGVLLGGMSVGILLLSAMLAGEIYDYQDTFDGAHLPPVDAIVCLAGGRGRISAAGDLWYRYFEAQVQPLPVLYFSGLGHQANWGGLVKHLRRGVLEALRPHHVVLETDSTNTESNAEWLAKYARSHKWKRILLLTSSYHMKRSRRIFERELGKVGYPMEIETLSVIQDPFEPGEWRSSLHGIRVTLLEYFKWIYYKIVWNP